MTHYSTPQSGNVKLTEKEANFFATRSNDDMKDYIDGLLKRREERMMRSINGEDVYGSQTSDGDTYFVPPPVDPYVIGCRAFAAIIADTITDRSARMIDIAAGTGFVGTEVKKHGFKHIDGIEPMSVMIQEQPTDVYNTMYREMLSDHNSTTIPSDYYDCAIIGGSVYPSHIEIPAFAEMLRIIKPGGHIIFNIVDYWYNYMNFGSNLDAMLQQRLTDASLATVIKTRCVYTYPYEDANVYILGKPEEDCQKIRPEP